MKKIGLMFMLAAVIAVGFSSCKKDDDNPDNPGTPAKPKPTVELISGANLTTASGNIPAGDSVNFKIHFTGENNLQKLEVRHSTNGGSEGIYKTLDITDEKVKSYDWLVTYWMPQVPGSEVKLVFEATMKDGNPGTHTITLTTTAPEKPVNLFANYMLGGQLNNDYGSFWDLSDLFIYKQTDADAKKGVGIDAVYYFGTTNKATLGSPDDSQVKSIFGNINAWTTQKKTRFAKNVFTQAEFNDMTMSGKLDAKTSSATLSSVTNLQVGDIILYVTENGANYGLMKVTAISAQTGSGFITLDVKSPN